MRHASLTGDPSIWLLIRSITARCRAMSAFVASINIPSLVGNSSAFLNELPRLLYLRMKSAKRIFDHDRTPKSCGWSA
jgi:hypothetical protein